MMGHLRPESPADGSERAQASNHPGDAPDTLTGAGNAAESREAVRLACIALTRLAESYGWEWSLASHEIGNGRWKYEIELDGPKDGDE